MFSGIIEEKGSIVAVETDSQSQGVRLTIRASFASEEVTLGGSICVDGVCLTVVSKENGFSFDLAEETLRKTTFSKKKIGDEVNLERSLKVGDRLHGHIVSGHVDSVGTLLRKEEEKGSIKLYFQYPSEFKKFLAQKGSITVSGVSLTLGEVSDKDFCVYIIPHTAEVTTLGQLKAGDFVNLEIDMIARYVSRMLEVRE